MPSFLELGVPAELASVLAADGKTEAFPIQQGTLPDSSPAATCSAVAAPAAARPSPSRSVARLSPASRPGRSTRGLVLAPTRELASQNRRDHRPAGQGRGPARDHGVRRRQPAPPGGGAAPRRGHRRGVPRPSRTS
jgi:superfamily II DNA/RNA helicase